MHPSRPLALSVHNAHELFAVVVPSTATQSSGGTNSLQPAQLLPDRDGD
jgi:hypothetical protein